MKPVSAILLRICFGMMLTGASRADTLSEQNNQMDMCWCDSCGKHVSCDTLQKESVSQAGENKPPAGKQKDAQEAK